MSVGRGTNGNQPFEALGSFPQWVLIPFWLVVQGIQTKTNHLSKPIALRHLHLSAYVRPWSQNTYKVRPMPPMLQWTPQQPTISFAFGILGVAYLLTFFQGRNPAMNKALPQRFVSREPGSSGWRHLTFHDQTNKLACLWLSLL